MDQASKEREYELLKKLSTQACSFREIAEFLKLTTPLTKLVIDSLTQSGKIENLFSDKYTLKSKYKQKLINQALAQNYISVPIVTKKTFDKVEAKNLIESKTTTNHELQTMDAINIYRAGGSQNKYYRYSYYHNGKIKHLHIKGGNISNPLVQKRVSELKNAIAHGKTHSEILKKIKSW